MSDPRTLAEMLQGSPRNSEETAMQLIRDLVLAGVGGAIATAAMGPITTKLSELQSERDRRREQSVSRGVAYEVAAEKGAAALGVTLEEPAREKVGMALHYGLGIGWAPVYVALRRWAGFNPVVAALAAGGSLSLAVDEAANPALGLTAPPGSYPLSTHFRGWAGHLAYGAVLAAVVEAGWLLLDRRA